MAASRRPGGAEGGRRRRWTAALAALPALAALLGACSPGPPGPPPASLGTAEHRSVPTSLAGMALTDQRGVTLHLADLHDRTVLLVPFLTLCSEMCPFDTGNLLQVSRSLRSASQTSRVTLIEMTVDPGRDDVARLAAYARLTGASWELVTEPPSTLAQFAAFFGWVVQQVPEGSPPSLDWLTHQPLTYDIDHTDGFQVVGTDGAERFSTGASPDFHGALGPPLQGMLSPTGLGNLKAPPAGGWDPAQALEVLGWLLGRTLPAPST